MAAAEEEEVSSCLFFPALLLLLLLLLIHRDCKIVIEAIDRAGRGLDFETNSMLVLGCQDGTPGEYRSKEESWIEYFSEHENPALHFSCSSGINVLFLPRRLILSLLKELQERNLPPTALLLENERNMVKAPKQHALPRSKRKEMFRKKVQSFHDDHRAVPGTTNRVWFTTYPSFARPSVATYQVEEVV